MSTKTNTNAISDESASAMIARVSYNQTALSAFDAQYGPDDKIAQIAIAPLRYQAFMLKQSMNDTENGNVNQCIALNNIRSGELYKLQGYGSVADFAADFCGISKSTAHARASVGAKFFADETPDELSGLTRQFPVSSLERLTSVPDDVLIDAFNSGVLRPEFSQKEVNAFVKAYKESVDKKPKKPAKLRFWEVVDSEGAVFDDEGPLLLDCPDNIPDIVSALREVFRGVYTGRFVKMDASLFDEPTPEKDAPKTYYLLLERPKQVSSDDDGGNVTEIRGFWEPHKFIMHLTKHAKTETRTAKIGLSEADYRQRIFEIATGQRPDERIQDYYILSDEC